MNLKKFISVLLAVAMIPIGGISFAARNEADGSGNKAGWAIETEAMTLVSNASAAADIEAVGGQAVIFNTAESGKCSAKVTVDTKIEGVYNVYARVIAQNGISGTVSVGDNEMSSIPSGTYSEYTWIKIADSKSLSSGENEVSLYITSDGVKIDQILVSQLASLPFGLSVESGKASFAAKTILPSEYPEIIDENVIGSIPAFEAGDRVLIVGDSITHSVGHTFQYHTWLLTYYATRYPESNFTYINAGRSGDTAANAMKRLKSDIQINDYNKVVIMLGTNDVNRNTWDSHRDDKEACDAVIETYIKNVDTLRKVFTDGGLDTTIIGPTCWNEFSQNGSNPLISGYNNELRRVNKYLQDYCTDNGLKYVDLNTPMLKALLYYTRKDAAFTLASDRTHPNEIGHYIMAYAMLKNQGEGSQVAGVEIDAAAKTANAQNAEISELSAENESVSYTYKPGALPLPADTYYRQVNALIPLEDELNRETIKVTNLTAGNYSIMINGVQVLSDVPSTDLEKGVNIADLENNPNQQTALKVKGIIDSRSKVEKQNIRDFRQTEYSVITNSTYGINDSDTFDDMVSKASAFSALESYVSQKKMLFNYYGIVNLCEKLIYTVNKPVSCNVEIVRTGDLDESTSVIHSYTKQAVELNEGAAEIRFDKVKAAESDFAVENSNLTGYTGNAKAVYVPLSVNSIDANAFGESNGIEYLYVPSSVTSIADGAFKNVKNVYISKNTFMNSSNPYKFEDGVLSEGNKIKYYSSENAAEEYEVDNAVDEIAAYAFKNAKVKKVTIYNDKAVIGENAFESDVTIKCYPDSTAHNYALENSLAFELMDYSNNTNLVSLKFNGTSVIGFDNSKAQYDIRLFATTPDIYVEAEAAEAEIGAKVEIINNGAEPPCAITARVTAQDGKTVKDYVLNFTVENAISNFNKYSSSSDNAIKQLRLDSKYSIYTGFDADANNQFLLSASNTSNEFGYGVVIQRSKSDAQTPTYSMPFYSNSGDPLLGEEDGRYWISFDISEPATVYVGINEGKVWTNAAKNGWITDDSGMKFYGLSGTTLYKKHFDAGTVQIPSFGTHSSYESKPSDRIEWNPSAYAVLFDSSFENEETQNAPFSVTRAKIGDTSLSESEANAPVLDRDTAYDSQLIFAGTCASGQKVTMIVTPVDDNSTLIAVDQKTASNGEFSFSMLPSDSIERGVTYKAVISNEKGESKTYYFKTAEIVHNVAVKLDPEVKKYFEGSNVAADSGFVYAGTRIGEKQISNGIVVHKTEVVDGVVTEQKDENGKYVMETVSGVETGVPFVSERNLHKVGQAGAAFKGLNHVLANTNLSPGRMLNAVKDSSLTWEGESISASDMHNKYCEFFAGENVFYTVTPDDDGTIYIALPYECAAYRAEDGWGHMVMANSDIPDGYASWRVVPESTYFSLNNPYMLMKYQHDATNTYVVLYSNVYYKSFKKDEVINVYTGGANYTSAASELPKAIIRWGEHLSIDTTAKVNVNGADYNINSDKTIYVEETNAAVSAVSDFGGEVTLSKSQLDTLPQTIQVNVTAAAGNSAVYNVTVAHNETSTKIEKMTYTIDGIAQAFDVDGLDENSLSGSVFILPSANVKSKMAKGVYKVTMIPETKDGFASIKMIPADGVLDFSKDGTAELTVTVTDGKNRASESFVYKFMLPVYNIGGANPTAVVRKIYGNNIISGYEGYSAGELPGYDTSAATSGINEGTYGELAYVIARSKGDAGADSPTVNKPFYGQKSYINDETGWWLTFNVTCDSTIYVVDKEGKGWPNKDSSYWSASSMTNVYEHKAKKGETVKIPNYGYSEEWETSSTPARLFKDPSHYIVVPDMSAISETAVLNLTALNGTISADINGSTSEINGVLTNEYDVGSTVVLTAGEGNFMYYKDDLSGRILSTDKTYEFAVGSDRSISAYFRSETDSDVYYVMFKNANGKIISSGYTSSEITVPNNPYLSGYVFDGWYDDNEKLEITAGSNISGYGFEKDTIIKAGFKLSEQMYNVYFANEGEQVYGQYKFNEVVTLHAPKVSGKVFVYWKRDGQIVSYNETYTFRMGLSDTVAEAVFADTAEEKVPVIIMLEPVVLTGEGRISFMAERDAGECKVIESGILLSQSAGITLENAEHKAQTLSNLPKGQFTIRKANLNAGDKWYARAYMIYEKDGEVVTAYSNEVSAIYN